MQNGYISVKFGAGCSSRPIIAYICRSNPAKKPLTYINDMNKIGIICIISITLLAVVLAACATTQSEKKAAEGTYDGELNILMLSDAGRNGSYDQRLIGEWMGVYADELGPEFVISCGDLFHYEGIQSTRDPLLWSNFESIYSHGELQCPWYGVLGNHEYRGNTHAMMDYTGLSRRFLLRLL